MSFLLILGHKNAMKRPRPQRSCNKSLFFTALPGQIHPASRPLPALLWNATSADVENECKCEQYVSSAFRWSKPAGRSWRPMRGYTSESYKRKKQVRDGKREKNPKSPVSPDNINQSPNVCLRLLRLPSATRHRGIYWKLGRADYSWLICRRVELPFDSCLNLWSSFVKLWFTPATRPPPPVLYFNYKVQRWVNPRMTTSELTDGSSLAFSTKHPHV